MDMDRRQFLMGSACVGAAALATGCTCNKGACAASCGASGKITFSICIGGCDLKLIQEMKEIGYDYFDGSVAPLLIPDKDDAAWAKQKAKIQSAALRPRSCNGFLPGSLHLTGPKEILTWDAALNYAEVACKRADEIGLDNIIFGSSGARNVPANYLLGGKREGTKVEEGRDQFIEFNKLLAKRIAGCKVVVAIEPLCPNESNIFNYVWQGMQLVKEVNSPRIKVLADFYHMMAGREETSSILNAGADLRHCHVATVDRKAPGLGDAGKVPEYFEALNKIGYAGTVSIEAGWDFKGKKDAEKRAQRAKALELMKGWAKQ